MENLGFTLLIASFLILFSLCLLGISFFLTGKSRLKPGACGKVPTKNLPKDDSCGNTSTCELCKKPDNKKET